MAESYSIAGKALKLDTEEDAEKYIQEIKEIKNLKEINLSGNTIGIGAAKGFSTVLKNQKNLVSVNFADIFTGRLKEEIPESLKYLLNALLTNPNLVEINLSDNAIGITAINPISDFISKHIPLMHLILSNNGLGPHAGETLGNSLKELAILKKSTTVKDDSNITFKEKYPLETFICGRNRLENDSMNALSNALAEHGTLKTVELFQNGIRQDGIHILLNNGLSANKNLIKLDLQDNTFTTKGSQALADNIHLWNNLQHLIISDCLLSPNGSTIFAKALLETNNLKNLKTLRLQYNEINSHALKFLVSALEENLNSIQLLELNGNKFLEDDPLIEKIQSVFEKRGYGELDELDDMEEDSEVENSSDDESDNEAQLSDKEATKDAEDEEDEKVPLQSDKDVDDLAEKLAKEL